MIITGLQYCVKKLFITFKSIFISFDLFPYIYIYIYTYIYIYIYIYICIVKDGNEYE